METLWLKRAEIVDDVREHTHAAFIADGTDHNVLANMNAREMDVAVVTFGQAFEAAALTVASLQRST